MAVWAAVALFCFSAGAQDAPSPLSLREAMSVAVEHNLTAKLARAEGQKARGKTLESAVNLLPHLMGTLSDTYVDRLNLRAEGFTFSLGGIPSLIGPFSIFDARVQLVQNLFDAEDWNLWRSAQSEERAVKFETTLAEEQVAAAAALSYIEALRARKAIESAQAGEDLAVQLMSLARDEKKAGAAAGIDVARAETREAEERLRLLDAKTASTEADLRFKRLVGLPLGQPVALSDALVEASTGTLQEADAITTALAGRWELKVASARLESEKSEVTAARTEHLPRIAAEGDIGLSGNYPDSAARTTGQVGVALSVPIFNGNHAAAKTKEARGARDQAQARLDDIRLQIEEDVRHSLDTLGDSAERAQTTGLAVSLAHRELTLARDRFAAGVGDNVEVVDAQTVAARNEDEHVAALAGLNAARINMALALGRMKDFGL